MLAMLALLLRQCFGMSCAQRLTEFNGKPAGSGAVVLELSSWRRSMEPTNFYSFKRQRSFWLIGGLVIVTAIAALAFVYVTGVLTPRSRQEEVALRGAQVMPFDLDQTVHVFEKLDDGGLQRVVVKDRSNKEQISLIRGHLKEEAEKFRRGDFSDPAKIHGQDMPGLAELKSAAGKIEV